MPHSISARFNIRNSIRILSCFLLFLAEVEVQRPCHFPPIPSHVFSTKPVLDNFASLNYPLWLSALFHLSWGMRLTAQATLPRINFIYLTSSSYLVLSIPLVRWVAARKGIQGHFSDYPKLNLLSGPFYCLEKSGRQHKSFFVFLVQIMEILHLVTHGHCSK